MSRVLRRSRQLLRRRQLLSLLTLRLHSLPTRLTSLDLLMIQCSPSQRSTIPATCTDDGEVSGLLSPSLQQVYEREESWTLAEGRQDSRPPVDFCAKISQNAAARESWFKIYTQNGGGGLGQG